MTQQSFRIRECSGMECAGVDDEAPVVRGVKLLGEESKNNRLYLPESVSPSQYEGRVINLNHPDGPNKQRRVEDRFGWVESCRKEGKDWRGDLHYNPKHPFAEQFAWLAKNKPELIGLSHDAVGTGQTKNGVFHVEKVLEVKSVDLVADPATTKGLFESYMEPELTPPAPAAEEESIETQIGKLVLAICKDETTDSKAKRKKVLKALKLLDDNEAYEEEEVEEEEESPEAEAEGGEGEEEDDEKKTEESVQALAKKYPGVKQLMETVDRLETKDRLREKTDLAHRLCEEAKLPSAAVSEIFLSQLIEAKDEKAMKALIEDRRKISSVQRPRSTGPAGGSPNLDNKSFAQQLTGAR